MIETSPAGELAMDHAVVHHQHILAVALHAPRRTWRNRRDRRSSSRESATKMLPSRPSGQPLADLDEKAVVDLAETCLPARPATTDRRAPRRPARRPRCRAKGSTPLSTANENMLAAIARSMIGRMVVMRELPAALITTSSESVFIVVSVCATRCTRANGTTIGMIDGRISVAISKKASADWPLSVTRSMRSAPASSRRSPASRTARPAKTSERPPQDIAFDDLHARADFRP